MELMSVLYVDTAPRCEPNTRIVSHLLQKCNILVAEQ
jgi:hypothetical protein